MADSFNKKEQQKKKAQKRKEKEARKEARKADNNKGSSLDDMIAYVDENGMIVDTPPDQTNKQEINAEDIELGIPKKEDLPEDSLYYGKVSFFNHDKGYGFIKDKNSQESYFVHMNNCKEPIEEGDRVEFELEKGDRGMSAVQVKKTEA